MEGSLNKVIFPKLGSLELPLPLCRNPEIPCFGSTLLFFLRGHRPNRGPRGRRQHLCVLLIRCSSFPKWAWAVWVDTWLMGRSRTDSGSTSPKKLPECFFVVLICALLECDRAMWLYPWPLGAPGRRDSASLAVGPPPPRFCCTYNKTFHFLTMADMRAPPPSLPPMNFAAAWRNRDIPTKKWRCLCGKVLPIAKTPESKAFSIQCSGTWPNDWVRYGKVVADFFQGSVGAHTPLLSMLIRVDKHPHLLGAVRLASTLPAAGAAVVAELGPTLQVPDLDVDSAMEMDIHLDAPILLRERKFSWGSP